MSKSAQGAFVRSSANRVTAVFTINGVQCTYTATLSDGVQAFTSSIATIHYDDADDLTNVRNCEGTIGTDTFELKLDNGVTIGGKLHVPFSTFAAVNGTGNWEQDN